MTHPRGSLPILLTAALLAGCALPGRGGRGPDLWIGTATETAVPDALVVAVGGGGTPREVIREMIRLGRERSAVPESGEVDVVVLPYASSREERGVASAAMWMEEGASTAVVAPNDAECAAALFAQAEILWMGGGDQGRLLDDLDRMGLVDDILLAHARGAIVGGTSAGAAVLGSVCIAGDPDPDAYARGGMTGRPGLGLIPGAIIDQHFRERRREGRLLTAVLDAGGLCGYGVSESTALLLLGDQCRVMGEGVVVVFDATEATTTRAGAGDGAPWRAGGITTSILTALDLVGGVPGRSGGNESDG